MKSGAGAGEDLARENIPTALVAVDPRAHARSELEGEQEAERHWWLGGTDAVRRALSIAAVGIPALQGRWGDAAAACSSLLLAHRACGLAKHIVGEERPDGSDHKSFPSSHAMETSCAATSLALASGSSLGVPAYAAVAWVAYGRLRADRHHGIDVAAGAASGAAVAWLAARVLATRGDAHAEERS
jgi:membrane-associated phospholipid phosphatase